MRRLLKDHADAFMHLVAWELSHYLEGLKAEIPRHQVKEWRRRIERVGRDADALASNIRIGYVDETHQDANVLKALLSEGVIQEAKKTHTKLNPILVQQLNASANLYPPLWNSDFYTAEMTADRMMGIVRVYLEKHPEKWGMHADELIESEFLEAYARKPGAAVDGAAARSDRAGEGAAAVRGESAAAKEVQRGSAGLRGLSH